MKIALCGASGTGKTTLAKALSARLGLPMTEYDHPEVPGAKVSLTRLLAYEYTGHLLPYMVDTNGMRSRFQRELVERKKHEEERYVSTYGGFITDRTNICNLVYSVLHDINSTGSDEEFAKEALVNDSGYDMVVYMSVGRFIKTGGDPARKQSRRYHQIYDKLLQTFVIDLELASGKAAVWLEDPSDTTEGIVNMIEDLAKERGLL